MLTPSCKQNIIWYMQGISRRCTQNLLRRSSFSNIILCQGTRANGTLRRTAGNVLTSCSIFKKIRYYIRITIPNFTQIEKN